MMNDMQRRYVLSLFAHIEEYRIKKFGKFSNKIPPTGCCHLEESIENKIQNGISLMTRKQGVNLWITKDHLPLEQVDYWYNQLADI